jgi:Icc-related predicted phosphoesterase
MRIVLISDTHTKHELARYVPDGEVLVHSGDFMNSGHDARDIINFNGWLGRLPHKRKVVIAGNHDRLFEGNHAQYAGGLLTNATYLRDSGVTIDGFKFYGSPWQPEFCNWAFNLPRGAALKAKWDLIPSDTDVLITHGPPYGIRDWTRPGGGHLGCRDLLEAVMRVKPQVHVFGHIHGGEGVFVEPSTGTKFINAAFLNEQYQPWGTPIHVIDLEATRE